MISQDLKKYRLPDSPGVYLFKRGRRILYVGKATSLKDRVKSYFSRDLVLTRGPKIIKMINEATTLDWQATGSVLEALVLEANLIKKYQPIANTDGKDDKSFNFVVITQEDFPTVKVVRGKDLLISQHDFSGVYGPYPHGGELKEALKIIRRIFPYRDEKCSTSCPVSDKKRKPCFNYQIGLCPGVCVGAVSQRDYGETIHHLNLFFSGRKDRVIKDLTRQMQRLAKDLKFEQAGEIKRKIFALQHIQDIALLKNQLPDIHSLHGRKKCDIRMESYDVAHISGKHTVGVMVVMEDGEFLKGDFRKFKLHGVGDTVNLQEILERRLKHRESVGNTTAWPLPDLIVVDGSTAQINVAEEVLANNGLEIPVVAVTKDEKHRAREIKGRADIVRDYHLEIIRLNQETHRFAVAYHRQRRDRVI